MTRAKRATLSERAQVRLMIAAWGSSVFGDFLALAALQLRLHEQDHSGLAIGGLLVAVGIPVVALNPAAGWLVDRVETRLVLVVLASAQTVVALALALFSSTAATIGLAFLLGCGLAIEGPALFTLVPIAAGERRANRAMSWLDGSRYAGLTLGFLCGGVITGLLGARAALMIDAVTFAGTLGTALALDVRRPPPRPSDARENERSALAGLRLLTHNRVLLTATLALAAVAVFAAMLNVAEVFYAKDELRAGDAGFGALVAAWGLGMVVGALAAGRRVQRETATLALGVTALITGVALVAAAVAGSLPIALLCFLGGGVANGGQNMAMRILLRADVPERLRGRAFAGYQGVMSTSDVVALAAGGVLVETIGTRNTLGAAGLGVAVAGTASLCAFATAPRADAQPQD